MPPSYEEANAGCPGYYGDGSFSWDNMYIRQIFIRKVYSILMLQLFTSMAVIALFTFYTPVRMYIQTHPVLYSISNLLFLVTYISLACCGDLRRQFPWNLILLTIFTLSMACMLGFISSFYNTKSVVLCVGITAVVCLCVTIFSFQSKVPWLHAVYASIGAVVFTMFLAFDTQLLMGNKQYSISPEEYIFATLSLYLDIVYLFTYLLQIFGNGRE
ncbi:fas apoptotic inhibitory molecule 2b isoform X2 [Paramisgurnus dabryanus]|uniref:fas apoptotic inhibitory molecule 2b isoform X2 n=1 Tax=Paramisgurnus dabryanus TaxID=90735 RepID=UPI003CCF5E86